MQEEALNGYTEHRDHNHSTHISASNVQSHSDLAIVNGDSARDSTPPADGPNGHDNNGGPPTKRRKVAELPRPVSPPWKRSAADGPTTYLENGRRKSGRVNVVPLELQPQSARRQTRAAFDKAVDHHQKFVKPQYIVRKQKNVDAEKKEIDKFGKRGPGRPPKARPEGTTPVKKEHDMKSQSPAMSNIAELEQQLARLKEDRRRARRRRASINGDDDTIKSEPVDTDNRSETASSTPERVPTSPLTLHKVTFRVKLPSPTIATPHNIAPAKRFSSFEEFLEKDDTEYSIGQDVLSPEQARKEALVRRKVREAQRPGGYLASKRTDGSIPKRAEPKQFTHQDHLLSHMTYFSKLMTAEHKTHRQRASIIAHEAKRFLELKAKQNKVKTREEIEHDERIRDQAVYRAVVKDVDKLWAAVLAEVEAQRQKEYEELQEAKIKGHLARVLDRTDQMLSRNAELEESMLESEDGTEESSDGGDVGSDSEQMSHSGSESSSGTEPEDNDAEMTLDQLRSKYATLPEPMHQSEEPEIAATSRLASTNGDAEDDSDPDTEMDSEFDDDDQESDDVDQSDKESDNGLASLLYSKQQIAEMTPEGNAGAVVRPASLDAQESASGSPTSGNEDDAEEDSDPDIEMDSEFESDEDGGSAEDEPYEEHQGLASLLYSEEQLAQMQEEGDEVKGASGNDVTPDTSAPLIQEVEGLSTQFADTRPDMEDLPHDYYDTVNPGSDADSPSTALVDQSTKVTQQASDLEHGLGTPVEVGSQEPSTQASPQTTTTKVTEAESISSPEPHVEDIELESDIKTPVPKLLRGTLRVYQHEGLDWLANLYANGRSGILADEMGLGKTIQSIAVLAHLAEVHEVWGPHLIVVPTSVMLNWEVEFKKFLPGFKIMTYYGSPEERKQKRRGWMAEDSFNVCITSYQLVLQDASSFKRRRWHYMILDEAHNIKNFRSERWQTMMTFNTRARLLLTGTPLQNNLTELWSLLFFLHYGQETQNEDDAFAGLQEWSEWFKKPVQSILEHNKQELDAEDKEQVAKLHKVIRPFLLRRLKADVEKQMPLKYEHVELCRLSKRQRQLYDGFMSRAQTKETLASGNYMSIINALMQLRKVCNHPDLFETRPINTSFAMPKSVAAGFEIRDLLVRRRILQGVEKLVDLDFIQLVPICNERRSMIEFHETTRRHAFHQIKALRDQQLRRVRPDKEWHGEQRQDVMISLENAAREDRLQDLDRTMYFEAYRHHEHPLYGRGLFEKLTVNTTYQKLSRLSGHKIMTRAWDKEDPTSALTLVQSIATRSQRMQPYVEKFGCLTPAAVTNDLSALTVSEAGAVVLRQREAIRDVDPFHTARMKLSIAFPDKRLLQYDCGKLQRLDKLLRRLQSGGHRALIFTQMTKVLDILEQFLNIHGHRYLRLDGSTKIEQRQMLTERFNNDNRILAFILSSRSGGLGINLTGADTVIFYDLDWNPAMDKQCTDRAHRIGQTRDVHIYRFVSEHTIESNILRKANQKQLLDDVVIQEGEFTTDYLNKVSYRDMLDDEAENDVAGAAMDRVLGNEKQTISAFEHAEDREDIAAAKVAAREVQHADDGDFEENAVGMPEGGDAQMLGPSGATEAALAEAVAQGHIDEYMIKVQRYLLRGVPLGPGKDRRKKGKRRDEHRTRRAR